MSGPRVYLGRLANSARERDVERFFKGYGKIREIILKEGYGFIEFDEARDADDAVYELNGKELCGDRVIVEHAKPPGSRGGMSGGGGRFEGGGRGYGGGYGGGFGGGGYGGGGGRYGAPSMRGRNPPPLRTDYRVRVENLSSKCSWQDLKDYMRQAGEVTYADAHKIHQNEGVVEFATSSDMKAALSKLDNTDLCGRKIKLSKESDGRGGGSRHRSRSGSDSRSRSPSRSKRRRSRSRSKDRRSRSPRSRSAERTKNGDKRSRSKERSKEATKQSRSTERAPARTQSKSRSRSRSPAHKSKSGSPERGAAAHKSRSRSHSRSHSAERM